MLTTLGGTLLSQYLVVSLKEEDWKSEARSHSSERASAPYCLWVHVAVSLLPAVSSPAALSGSFGTWAQLSGMPCQWAVLCYP